jgi:hypothetical protein
MYQNTCRQHVSALWRSNEVNVYAFEADETALGR